MTRERLEGLPMNALLELSRKENLDLDPGVGRDELIDSLLEAYEEDQKERETLNNLIIKIEQSKFSLLGDEFSLESKQTAVPTIPDSYDENSVSILLRDPTWALAIWEVRKLDKENLVHEFAFRGYGLKVFEYENPNAPNVAFFLIPLPQSSGTRYIHLPTQGRWYALELHAVFERETRLLARSRMVFSPLEMPPFIANPSLLDNGKKKLLELSGIHLCEPLRDDQPADVVEKKHSDIPQRIGDWDESLFQDQNP